ADSRTASSGAPVNAGRGLVGEAKTPAIDGGGARRRRRMAAAAFGAAGLIVLGAGALSALHVGGGSAPRRGGILHIASAEDSERFDVFSVSNSRTRHLLDVVVERLFEQNIEGEIAPAVVEHAELRDSGKTLVLELRPGVRFHAHPCFPGGKGRDATAEDLAASFFLAAKHHDLDLAVRGKAEVEAGRASALEGVRVSGPREVSLALDEPSPFFASGLSQVRLLPKEIEGCEDLSDMRQPVGTGPFRFAGPPTSSRLDLVRAEDYWKPGMPRLDGLEFRDSRGATSMLPRVERGELDILELDPAEIGTVLDFSTGRGELVRPYANAGLRVGAYTSHTHLALLAIVVSDKKGPLSDRNVRLAIANALDRPALAKLGEAFLASPSGRFLEPRVLGYDPSLEPVGFDVARARAFLEKSGHPRGEGLPEIELGYTGQERVRPLAQELVAELGQIGLQVRVVPLDAGGVMTALHGGLDAVVATDRVPIEEGEVPTLLDSVDLRADSSLKPLNHELRSHAERRERAAVHTKIERALLEELPSIPIAWSRIDRPGAAWVYRVAVHDAFDPQTGYGVLDGPTLAKVWLAP
ncbi:MAG TPA: ABC transporter substrate-binding protein, partial [bacterium]|nr:ABC transporter substrate-binding protein [bacterium]